MRNVMKAIVWKEYMSLRHRAKKLVFSVLFAVLYLVVFGIIKVIQIQNTPQMQSIIENIILYVCVTTGYLILISLLRFSQEKTQKTLESLLCLPVNPTIILLSKCFAAVLLCVMISFFESIILHIIFILLSGAIFVSLKIIVCNLFICALLYLTFSIINGYITWCMNATYVKLMSYITALTFIGLVSSFLYIISFPFYMIFLTFLGIGIILLILAIFFLRKVDKEKIVLNLQD